MKALDSELIRSIADSYGFQDKPTYFAGGHDYSDAMIYSFSQDKICYLMKIMEVKDESSIAIHIEQQVFASYLASRRIPTASPILSRKPMLCEKLEWKGQLYLAYCWQKIDGHPLADIHPKELTGYYQSWATLIAKMHLASREYPQGSIAGQPDGDDIPSWEREWDSFYDWIPDQEVKSTWLELKERLSIHPKSRQNFGFIHNDAHPQNILQRGTELLPIDFDVATNHWFILDIAICIYSEFSRIGFHSHHKSAYPAMHELFLEPFLATYQGLITLPNSDWDNIELFLQYRRIVMFTVFYEQIKKGNAAYLEQFKRDIIAWKPFL